jgi:hypothetical protein
MRVGLKAFSKSQNLLVLYLLGYYDDFNITLEPLRLTPSGG